MGHKRLYDVLLEKDAVYAKENFSVYFYKVGNAGILSVIVDSYANKGLLSIEMDKVATLVKDLIIVKS